MARGDHAVAHGQGAAKDPGDPQFFHPVGHPHQVQDGIQGPQFVEVHLLQGLAVNPGLHLSQETEHGQAALLHPGAQGGTGDQVVDFPVAPGGLGAAEAEIHSRAAPR